MTQEGEKAEYHIDLAPPVTRQLNRVPDRDYPRVSEAIRRLSYTPRPIGCRKLMDSLYRIRVGRYRVIYCINDRQKSIIITKVDLRKERTYKIS